MKKIIIIGLSLALIFTSAGCASTQQGAVVGALAGGVAGAGAYYFLGDQQGKDALSGAAIGAVVGALLGALEGYYKD